MSPRRYISGQTQEFVRERANELCEYCHTSEKWQYVHFTIDHIISLSQGGTNENDNLALACFHCNRYKSNHLTGIDPESGLSCSLFNPRVDIWDEHFIWSMDGAKIIALTSVGRATVARLQINRPRIVNIRKGDVSIGRHPPLEDLRMEKPQ